MNKIVDLNKKELLCVSGGYNFLTSDIISTAVGATLVGIIGVCLKSMHNAKVGEQDKKDFYNNDRAITAIKTTDAQLTTCLQSCINHLNKTKVL